ncbi:hypothetical protein B7463_g3560, partial [Scytalidium lignicola]
MVSTRTKTGAIEQKHYDVQALRKSEITASPGTPLEEAESSISRQTNFRKDYVRLVRVGKVGKAAKRRAYQKKTKRITSLPTDEVDRVMRDFTTVPTPPDTSSSGGDVQIFPRLAIGRQEQQGMSKIMRADRDIETWEEIRRVHEEHMPHILPMIDENLERARAERNELEDNEENNRIGEKNEDQICVQKRVGLLEDALMTSRFEPERENIIAAIEGYKSGQMTYQSEVYTLIYAGKIVDTASSYASFVVNRQKRLDAYAAKHGQHWLWYESPLKVAADSKPMLARTAELVREIKRDGLGAYWINQGFWKRADWVARLPGMAHFAEAAEASNFAQRPNGTVYCQSEGPKLSFRCLFDSGANHPLLMPDDFKVLGVDKDNYAAQSLVWYNTPSGDMVSRVYEMFISVLDENGISIVDENNPVWPLGVRACGSLCPVCESPKPPEIVNGVEANQRLSGMLPFLASYISSTPTNNVVFLGEDRRDVLGTHRMPGQRKWDITMPYAAITTNPRWASYDNPITTFTHNGGRIVDEDLENQHGSRLTVNKGTELEMTIDNIPGKDYRSGTNDSGYNSGLS